MRGIAAALFTAVALVGCGGGKDDDRLTLTTPKAKETPSAEATATPAKGAKKVTRAEEATIRGWADALRNGKVDRAVRYWAVPAVFSNGDPPIKLPTVKAIRAINAGFPCGAKVVSVQRDPHDRDFVDAVFVLTERRGSARPCDGTGGRAATAFRIRNHRIVEWLRLPNPPEGGGSEADSS
jgi:hypothetical protein